MNFIARIKGSLIGVLCGVMLAVLGSGSTAHAKQFSDSLPTDFYAGADNDIQINQNLKGSLQLATYGNVVNWVSTKSLSSSSMTLYLAAGATYNGKIYLTGGYGNTDSYSSGPVTASVLNKVWFGTMQADGSISEWKEADENARLPQPTYGHASVVVNGRLYVIGGRTTSNQTLNTVQWAKIMGWDGSIKAFYKSNTWTAVAALPQGLYRPSAVVNEGRIYVVGGQDASNVPQSKVYYAAVLPNGDITGWSTATTDIGNSLTGLGPYPISQHSALIVNGQVLGVVNTRLYVVGGTKNGLSQGATGSVTSGLIDPVTGDITQWYQEESLPNPIYAASAAVAGGKMWVMGGFKGGMAQTSVYYSRIKTDGHLSNKALVDPEYWTTATDMPVSAYNHVGLSFNNHLYLIGGNNSTGSQSGVYTTTLIPNKVAPGGGNKLFAPTTPMFVSASGEGRIPIWSGHSASVWVPLPGSSVGATSSAPTVFVVGGGPNTSPAYPDGIGNIASLPQGFASIYRSEIDATGNLKSWTLPDSGGELPIWSILHTSVVANGNLYIIGGANSTNAYIWCGAGSHSMTATAFPDSAPGVNPATFGQMQQAGKTTVLFQTLSGQGSGGVAGSISETAPIPIYDTSMTVPPPSQVAFLGNTGDPIYQPLMRAKAVSANGIIYVLGGVSRTNDGATWGVLNLPNPPGPNINIYYPTRSIDLPQDKVWYCRPSPNGPINDGASGWSQTTPLPGNRWDLAACVAYNRVYYFGGRGPAAPGYYREGYFADINPDGSLGIWTPYGLCPQGIAEHEVLFIGGKFVMIGGTVWDNALSTTLTSRSIYIEVPDPGTGGPSTGATVWAQDNTILEYPMFAAPTVYTNGFIYVLGGHSDGGTHAANTFLLDISNFDVSNNLVYSSQGTFERYVDLESDQLVTALNWEGDTSLTGAVPKGGYQVKARWALENGAWTPWSLLQESGPTMLQTFARYIHYKVSMITNLNTPANPYTPQLKRIYLDYAGSKRMEDDSFQINHNRFDPQTDQLLISFKTGAQEVSTVILRVYNLEGEMIRRQDFNFPAGTALPATGSWTWDGTNDNGEYVANGVFIIQYNSGETHKIRKVAVIKR